MQYQNVSLRKLSNTTSDKDFILSLFRIQDIKQHFLYKNTHVSDIYTLVRTLITESENGQGAHFIVENNSFTPVGLVSSWGYKNPRNGEIGCIVDLAILPAYRNKGFAANAIQAVEDILSDNPIKVMVLDFGTGNIPARAVAAKCGFSQRTNPMGGVMGYYDDSFPEVGMRTKWAKRMGVSDLRADVFRKGNEAFMRKDYATAIRLYNEAMQKPYRAGSPFTDAMAYSNIGMAYSSLRQYRDAYVNLMKAWNMGCQNPSVAKELEWLRRNAPHVIY